MPDRKRIVIRHKIVADDDGTARLVDVLIAGSRKREVTRRTVYLHNRPEEAACELYAYAALNKIAITE